MTRLSLRLALAICSARCLGRSPSIHSSGLPFARLIGRGESLSYETAGVLSGAEHQGPTTDGFREVCAAVLVALVSLAECPRGGKTGDLDRLATAGLPAFLALEITRWATEVA